VYGRRQTQVATQSTTFEHAHDRRRKAPTKMTRVFVFARALDSKLSGVVSQILEVLCIEGCRLHWPEANSKGDRDLKQL